MDENEIFEKGFVKYPIITEVPRCEYCKKKLNKNNCTVIGGYCDDCLANEAADRRQADWENGVGFE